MIESVGIGAVREKSVALTSYAVLALATVVLAVPFLVVTVLQARLSDPAAATTSAAAR